MDLKPRDRVDRYLLVEMLGEGAQGSVWKAEDPLAPGQPRALKLMRLVAARPDDAERARREARGLAKLEHPSLVTCHTLFEDLKLGVLGMALDFVDGQSLGKALNDSRLSDRHRVNALRHVAHALAYVHGEGHLHRDLKLDNVLVTQKFWENPEEPSNVKLVDFGIARFGVADHALTATNAIVGTMTYIAPELLDPRFFGTKDPTPAADVFAFGVLAYRILIGGHPTGLPPGSGLVDYGAAYRRAAERDEPWPPGLPASAWGELLGAALAVRPEKRIRDGGELAPRVEQAGDFSHVIRTAGPADPNPGQSPMSVAGPAAMHGVTAQIGPAARAAALEPTALAPIGPAAEPAKPRAAQNESLDPTLLASVAPQVPIARAPSGRVPEPEFYKAKGGTGIIGTITVVIAAAVVIAIAYKIVATPGDNPPPPATLVPIALGTEPIVLAQPAPSAPDAEPDGVELDAVSEASLPNLPPGCSPTSTLCECCPSATDCGGSCAEPLEADDSFRLRLGSVVQRDAAELGGVMVCARTTRSAGNICVHASSVLDAKIPEQALYVDTPDFLLGIDLEVFGGQSASVARAQIKEKPKRLALCQGIEVTFSEGPIEKARFYLDSPGAAPLRRCSTTDAGLH